MNVGNLEGFDRSFRKEFHPRSAIVRRICRVICSPERLEARQLLALVVENQMVPVGSAIAGKIATFDSSDLNGNPLDKVQATVDWGNGTTTIASIIPLTNDKYDVAIPVDKAYVYPKPASLPSFKGINVRLKSTEATTKPVDLSSPGTLVIVSSTASSGTTIETVQNTDFSGPVGFFFDSRGTGAFTSIINWGDGTSSPGEVVKLNDSKPQYQINGSHRFLTAGNPPGTKIKITISVYEKDSQVPLLTIESFANVTASSSIADNFDGRLAHSSDTGPSDNDNITNTSFPVFEGNAVPYSVILLYGRRFDYKQEVLLGRTVAGLDGKWQITAGPLADGRYVITGSMTTPNGQVVQKTFCSDHPSDSRRNPLIIDTIGLSIVRIQRNPRVGTSRKAGAKSSELNLTVYFQPNLATLDEASLKKKENYALQQKFHEDQPFYAPDAPNDPTNMADFAEVKLKFKYARANESAKLRIYGVQDMAGNILSGVFPINTRAYLTRKLPLR